MLVAKQYRYFFTIYETTPARPADESRFLSQQPTWDHDPILLYLDVPEQPHLINRENTEGKEAPDEVTLSPLVSPLPLLDTHTWAKRRRASSCFPFDIAISAPERRADADGAGASLAASFSDCEDKSNPFSVKLNQIR